MKFKKIFRIFYKEYRKSKYILKKIIKAKQLYEEDFSSYMCCCIQDAFNCFSWQIPDMIPEFRPETFNVKKEFEAAWWPGDDRKSRIDAFDKMIDIYEGKLKKYNE